ncbi:putative transcription factor bZIP family [Helianthus anomalus]
MFTDKTVVEEIAKFLGESKIAKALTNKTIVYESHVRRFWYSPRYEEEDKMIYSAVRKKDKNGQDVDLEIKFGVGDPRRVLELGHSDDDPTIIPERLCKGLWCRMGFTGHINGKMIKTMFCHAYKFMIHCVVHALSHRKGAYDETSDYIMNIITCRLLNRPYNVSKVIFEYMLENIRAGSNKYIMYPRFIMMMIDDQFKDIQKDNGDILGLRNMTSETITRLTKGTKERDKRMIRKINNPAYVATKNDRWRHENSSYDDEDEKMSQMIEKKTIWWFVRDGKRKRTPKTSPVVPIPKDQAPKIVVKGTVKGGVIMAFERTTTKVGGQDSKNQSSSVQAENVKDKEPKGVACDDSSEDVDSESTKTETELDLTTLGRGKTQLKKKPTKKKKAPDEEDSTYVPPEKTKKLRAKRKAVQSGVIPRNVHAKKIGATLPKDQEGMKEKHVKTSKVHETEKIQGVEVPKEPEVEVQKKAGNGDDYVEITRFKVATPPPPPPPPPQEQPIPEAPESSRSKNTFRDLFGELPHATGVYRDDMGLDDDFDVFNNAAIKELQKKVGDLEKEKAKAKSECDVLKKQVEKLTKENEEIKTVMINQAKNLKNLKGGVHDNSQLFELLTAENDEMNEKMKKLEEINEMLKGMISDLHEAS